MPSRPSALGLPAQSVQGGVGPKLVSNEYDPGMAVGPASGAGAYRMYALLQSTSYLVASYLTVGTFLHSVARRTFAYQTRYRTSASSHTVRNILAATLLICQHFTSMMEHSLPSSVT